MKWKLWSVSVMAWLVLVWMVAGCASAGGPRHVATVSIVTAHSTLAAVQDTEAFIVCGMPTALPAPKCVSPEDHKAFAKKLVVAFDIDEKIATQVRAWPANSPVPPVVANLLSELQAIVDDLLAALPDTPATQRLITTLKGGQ